MRQSEQMRVVVMVILPAGAEGRRDGKPVSDIHGVIVLVVIAARAETTIVGPIVLNHVHPQREEPHAAPERECVLPVANNEPEQHVAADLREGGEIRIRNEAEWPCREDRVVRDVGLGPVRDHASNHRLPVSTDASSEARGAKEPVASAGE